MQADPCLEPILYVSMIISSHFSHMYLVNETCFFSGHCFSTYTEPSMPTYFSRMRHVADRDVFACQIPVNVVLRRPEIRVTAAMRAQASAVVEMLQPGCHASVFSGTQRFDVYAQDWEWACAAEKAYTQEGGCVHDGACPEWGTDDDTDTDTDTVLSPTISEVDTSVPLRLPLWTATMQGILATKDCDLEIYAYFCSSEEDVDSGLCPGAEGVEVWVVDELALELKSWLGSRVVTHFWECDMPWDFVLAKDTAQHETIVVPARSGLFSTEMVGVYVMCPVPEPELTRAVCTSLFIRETKGDRDVVARMVQSGSPPYTTSTTTVAMLAWLTAADVSAGAELYFTMSCPLPKDTPIRVVPIWRATRLFLGNYSSRTRTAGCMAPTSALCDS